MPVINKIGQINKEHEILTVTIDSSYRKGLKDIEKFSHIHLFCINPENIFFSFIGKIVDVDMKTGILEITEYQSLIKTESNTLELVDVKPYLPSEDYVTTKSNITNNKYIPVIPDTLNGNYFISSIGEIRNTHGRTYIQYNDEKEMPTQFSEYARIIWWFDRFEKKEYRRILQCDTPYETNGKVGVFSCRSPVRPNPIAVTVVKILNIERDIKRVYIEGIESYDHTPFLGMIDYNSAIDCIKKEMITLPEWTHGWPDELRIETEEAEMNVNEYANRIDACLENDVFHSEDNDRIPNTKQEDIKRISPTHIRVKGAAENNLKGISVSIPYGKITAVVGVSGSGKSSLVMDTVYAECSRRMEYLNSEVSMRMRPKMDDMEGCIPTVIISQKDIRNNSKSTIGTYCGIDNHLRAIYAGIGEQNYRNPNKVKFKLTPSTFNFTDPECRCQKCNGNGNVFTPDLKKIIAFPEKSLLDGASPFLGKLKTFIKNPNANWMKGQVIALADECKVNLKQPWCELPQTFRDTILYGDPNKIVNFSYDNKKNGRRGEISRKVEGIIPIINRLYIEDNHGGLAEKFMSENSCDVCNGEKLEPEGRLTTILGVRYPVAINMDFRSMRAMALFMKTKLPETEKKMISEHIDAIISICNSAIHLGIDYLELNRGIGMVSGGESQRIKLLSAFCNHMSGILYIFDEPSKNMSEQEYCYIIDMMKALIKEGNTILMVEHNLDMIRVSDYVIEIGPEAGAKGGYLIAEGSLQELIENKNSMLSKYVDNTNKYIGNNIRKSTPREYVTIQNVTENNLKNVSVSIPKQVLSCITGVSGSGKSSLMYYGILPQMSQASDFDQVVLVESKIMGGSSRSVVATYAGLMDEIRLAYCNTDSAITAGYTEKDFSFNTGKLKCEACKGDGRLKIPYAQDSYVKCPTCHGKRYTNAVSEFIYNKKDITEVLDMSVEEASHFFEYSNIELSQKCKMLCKVGLPYIKLGQSTGTLSGGEAARLKIACCLMNAKMNNVLFLLDEPTCGLHFSDIDNLISLLYELVDAGNTVVAIEHNKRFLSAANYIITMGPGSGRSGGKVCNN